MLTVGELKELLKEFDDNTQVVITAGNTVLPTIGIVEIDKSHPANWNGIVKDKAALITY